MRRDCPTLAQNWPTVLQLPLRLPGSGSFPNSLHGLPIGRGPT